MPNRFYYLGPWQTSLDDDGSTYYHAPEGVYGLVDLRPLSPTHDFGFFASDIPLNGDYTAFGDGETYIADMALTPQQRSLWSSMLGIGALSGTKLLDALWETLTVHADPEGGNHAKPIIPTVDGNLELWLPGHSLVHSRKFQGESDPSWSRVQKVMQDDYRAMRAYAMRKSDEILNPRGNSDRARWLASQPREAREAWALKQRELPLRWLECMRRKLRIDPERANQLVPGDLPFEGTREPETTLNETWPTNGTDIGTGQDNPWTEMDGAYEVASNDLTRTSGGTWTLARCDTALSSADHYAKVISAGSKPSSSDELWVAARVVTGGAHTYYCTRLRGSTATTDLFKGISSSYTSLATDGTSWSIGDSVQVRCNGSSITARINDTQIMSVTDTSITGNTLTGCGPKNNTDASDWEASDLAAGGAKSHYYYQQQAAAA